MILLPSVGHLVSLKILQENFALIIEWSKLLLSHIIMWSYLILYLHVFFPCISAASSFHSSVLVIQQRLHVHLLNYLPLFPMRYDLELFGKCSTSLFAFVKENCQAKLALNYSRHFHQLQQKTFFFFSINASLGQGLAGIGKKKNFLFIFRFIVKNTSVTS